MDNNDALVPGSLGVETGPKLPPFTFLDWESVDWSKTNTEISQITGYSYLTVLKHRKRLGKPPSSGRWAHSKYSNVPWDSFDWTQSNNELSRRSAVPIGIIRRYRETHNKPAPTYPIKPGPGVIVTDQMIEGTDWKFKRDMDLAIEWGISRERVRQIRQEHRKPQCAYKNQSGKLLACLRWIDLNRPYIEGRHLNDVLPLLPEGTRQIRMRALKKSGVTIDMTYSQPGCNPHIRIVNWDLPNIVLMMIWTDFGRQNGIPSARSRFGLQPTKWDTRFGRRPIAPDLLQAIDAEITKAKSVGVVPDEAAVKQWIQTDRRRK